MGQNLTLRYEETGEVRPPRKGEWFRDANGSAVQAKFDFSQLNLPILREVLEPKKEEVTNG